MNEEQRRPQSITVRRMPFEFPDEIDPMLFDQDALHSYFVLATSLMFPYLEPYLIRSMRAAKPHVKDPALLEDLERFCAQEGQHYRMHKRLNDQVRVLGFPRLEQLERELEADYQRFSATKPLRFNLAYAEGFEALTGVVAQHWLEHDNFSPNSRVADVWRWHLLEELEHATVAYDVYEHVVGSYPYRVAISLRAQAHFLGWINRVTNYMLEVGPADRRKTTRSSGLAGTLRELFGPIMRTYLPGYTPHDNVYSDEIRALIRRYTAMATRTR